MNETYLTAETTLRGEDQTTFAAKNGKDCLRIRLSRNNRLVGKWQ